MKHSSPRRRASVRGGLLALIASLTLALVPPAAGAQTVGLNHAANAPAPVVANPSATGARLAERFLGLLKAQDKAGLRRFLAPDFQLQRADGSGATKAAYLTALPTISDFVVSDAVGTAYRDTLVVRYLANVAGVANSKPYTAGFAPRLSTFRWDGRRWQLVSHANFNPLDAEAASPGVQVLLDKVMTTVLGQPLSYPSTAPAQVSSSILTLSPGQQTGWHYHDAPMYAYVMSGAVQVTYDGGIVNTYSAGEAIMEAVGTHHNGQNVGSADAVLLIVNIGAEGVPNTVLL